jgi:hypothetical protein
MKLCLNHILFGLLLFVCGLARAQDTAPDKSSTVTVTGSGTSREAAIDDARRNAIAKVCGMLVDANTQMDNFIVVRDAVSTNTRGYIKDFKIIGEGVSNGINTITAQASVSNAPVKQDAESLSQLVGGIRFMVIYDERKLGLEQIPNFEWAYNRINEKFSEGNIRYVEAERFRALREEAYKILGKDTTESSYVQKLGLFADAEFLVSIKSMKIILEDKAVGTSARVILEAITYDNCTAEGLGTVVLEGDAKLSKDPSEAIKMSITSAIVNGYPRLMMFFNKKVGTWLNGSPFELRFYGISSPRALIPLVDKIRNDRNFGGQLNPVQTPGFLKYSLTFKAKSYDMYTKILEYADEIPALKGLQIDAKLQYGRQISFAPTNVVVPEAVERQKVIDKVGQ